MTADHVMRGILTAEVFTAVLLFGPFLGLLWHDRGWPIRIVLIGLHGMLIYVLAGQVKAFNLGIPYDGFSVGGTVAAVVLDVGLGWSVYRERRRPGQG